MMLKRPFYKQSAVTVARNLLGKKLVREYNGALLSGTITETEAYLGIADSASHGYKGLTPRNRVLFGEAGMAYVYIVYGYHFMLNIVTGKVNEPFAVLIRAMEPLDGVGVMTRLRKNSRHLADGPAKLCQAIAIDKTFNGWDLTKGELLWIEDYRTIPDNLVKRTPRIGIDYALQQDRDALLRFVI